VDSTGLIFVGLGVAWGAYGLSKALEHHDASHDVRAIDKFSHTMRVLARREAVDRSRTALVTKGRRPTSAEQTSAEQTSEPVAEVAPGLTADPEQTGFFAAQTFVRRSTASRAARRRRRVLGGLLVLLAMVGAVAAGQVISFWWVALPVALLVGWLVASRLMVKGEQAVRRNVRHVSRPTASGAATAPVASDVPDTSGAEASATLDDDTAEVPVVRAEVAEPIASGDGWELVPVTLPTYVSKPAARRTVSTIDLDSTGVWTSGRTAADSALAQQADAARAADKQAARTGEPQRRVGGA
jgi:hypothetical protein